MLVAQNFVTKYFQANSLLLKLGGCGYAWNRGSLTFLEHSASSWSYFWRGSVFAVIALSYMIDVIRMFLILESCEQEQLPIFIQKVMVGSLFLYFAYHFYDQATTFPLIRQFLNQLVQLEQKYIQG